MSKTGRSRRRSRSRTRSRTRSRRRRGLANGDEESEEEEDKVVWGRGKVDNIIYVGRHQCTLISEVGP